MLVLYSNTIKTMGLRLEEDGLTVCQAWGSQDHNESASFWFESSRAAIQNL